MFKVISNVIVKKKKIGRNAKKTRVQVKSLTIGCKSFSSTYQKGVQREEGKKTLFHKKRIDFLKVKPTSELLALKLAIKSFFKKKPDGDIVHTILRYSHTSQLEYMKPSTHTKNLKLSFISNFFFTHGIRKIIVYSQLTLTLEKKKLYCF